MLLIRQHCAVLHQPSLHRIALYCTNQKESNSHTNQCWVINWRNYCALYCTLNSVHWDNLWESQGCIMVNEAPREVPESTQWISRETPLELVALPQSFIITYLLDQFLYSQPVHAPPPILLRMRRIAKRSRAPSAATALRPMVAPRVYHTKWCNIDGLCD